MSILRSKHSGWTWEGRRTPFGGGGGGPSQTTTYSTNIPEYARPYVENMLGATQSQLFQTEDVGAKPATYDAEGNMLTPAVEGRREITGFRPYKPYSQNVQDYFAGPSPLMEQSYRAAANLRTPEQIAAGSRLAEAGGEGFLGTTVPAGIYGALGAGYGAQAAGAGERFAREATSPEAVGRYMSPFMQNVVDYQKSQALRDYQMAAPMRQAQAVGQGAFGGNRLALQQSEAQRGLMSQLQGIEATGRQKAFEDAQRQMQYGAGLGIQGLQAGMQGAGVGLQGVGAQQAGFGGATQSGTALGGLGTQQLGAQTGIINLQNQLGLQQQMLEQQKINQAISDYATQQQYPMLQLGFMSNMLRGLPMQAQTTQMYQAQPTALQQGIGAVGALGSLYGAGGFNRREGGIVGMRSGGKVPGFKYGKLISEPKLESMADDLSIQQLQQRLKDPALTPGERQVFAEALEAKMRQEQARMSGIAAVGGPAFESQGMAGGGIVAFDDGGLSMLSPEFGGGDQTMDQLRMEQLQLQKDIDQYNFLKEASPVAAERMLASNPTLKNKVTPAAPVETAKPPAPKDTTTAKGATGEKGETGAKGEGARSVAQTGASNVSEYLKQIRGLGPQGRLGEDTASYIKERLAGSDERLKRAQNLAALQGFVEFGTKAAPGGIGQAALAGFGKYGEGYGKAFEAEDKIKSETIKMGQELDAARRAEERGDVKLAAELFDKAADRDNRIKAAQIGASATGQAGRFEQEAVQRVMAENPKLSFAEALQIVRGAGRFESTEVQRAKVGLDNIVKRLGVMSKKDPERPALEKQYQDLMRYLTPGGGIGGGTDIPQGVTVKKVG
jgi:hypothetical protein